MRVPRRPSLVPQKLSFRGRPRASQVGATTLPVVTGAARPQLGAQPNALGLSHLCATVATEATQSPAHRSQSRRSHDARASSPFHVKRPRPRGPHPHRPASA